MIIVEGIDGAGKSTLCRALCEKLAARGQLARFERYGKLPPWWNYGTDYLRSCEPGAVLDRFTASEAVYGPEFRSGIHPLFDEAAQGLISREQARCGSLTVHLACAPEVARDRALARGDADMADLYPRFTQLARRYDALFFSKAHTWDRRPHLTFLTGELDDAFFKATAKRVLEEYEELQRKTQWYRDLRTDGHGPTDATCQLLLVGDELSSADGIPRAFSGGPAARHLNRLLDLAGYDPRLVHLVNSRFADGRELTLSAVRWAPACSVPIVALGALAAGRLRALDRDLSHREFPHPQFIGRFKRAAFERHAELLASFAVQVAREVPCG